MTTALSLVSFPQELRNQALCHYDADVRRQLTWAANKIESDIRLLSRNPTEVNLRAVNGSWAYALRLQHKPLGEGEVA